MLLRPLSSYKKFNRNLYKRAHERAACITYNQNSQAHIASTICFSVITIGWHRNSLCFGTGLWRENQSYLESHGLDEPL